MKELEKIYALIVAGGSGSRMQSSVPKQFLLLCDKPLLMYTIEAFHRAVSGIEIFLVLPQDQFELWKFLCGKHHFEISHKLIAGGKTRGASVVNGLNEVDDAGIVLIHDGVRPFVSSEIIVNSIEVAGKKGSAVAVVAPKDSIREITETGSRAVDRGNYRIVQTPQTFKASLIKNAYKTVNSLDLSDDATVAELAGNEINLVWGSYQNLKITTPEDLLIAERFIKS